MAGSGCRVALLGSLVPEWAVEECAWFAKGPILATDVLDRGAVTREVPRWPRLVIPVSVLVIPVSVLVSDGCLIAPVPLRWPWVSVS